MRTFIEPKRIFTGAIAVITVLLSAPFSAAQSEAEPPPAVGDSPGNTGTEEESRVATLLDADTTKVLHDDTTVLRTVSILDDQGLMLFDAVRIWLGGAIQYDYYNFDGIYSHTQRR